MSLCPECGNLLTPVAMKTLKHLLSYGPARSLQAGDFFHCTDPDCDIVYVGMPEASWCRSCRDYVWVDLGGGCSEGHPRSDLREICEAPAVAGVFVPPPPQRPDGVAREGYSQVDILPHPQSGTVRRGL